MDILGVMQYRKDLIKKAEQLRNKGADVKNIIKRIKSKMVQDLSSIEAELNSLELLSKIHTLQNNHIYEKYGDHYFELDHIAYEVKKATIDSKIGKKITNTIGILSDIYTEPGYHIQVTYADSPEININRINSKNVKSVTEILAPTSPYKREIANKVNYLVRDINSQFKKKKYHGNKIAIIDVTDLPISPLYLRKRIYKYFKEKSFDLTGALLLLYDSKIRKPDEIALIRFLTIPNIRSSSPISYNDYEEIETKDPLYLSGIYANPMRFKLPRKGPNSIFRKERDNTFSVLGDEIGDFLIKDSSVMFNGFIGKPSNLNWIQFSKNNKIVRRYNL